VIPLHRLSARLLMRELRRLARERLDARPALQEAFDRGLGKRVPKGPYRLSGPIVVRETRKGGEAR
jgi:hypothetical protein